MKLHRSTIAIILSVLLSVEILANTSSNEVEISDISYDYELVQDSYGGIDCVGTLKMNISTSPEADYVIFVRTKDHCAANDRLIFGASHLLTLDDDHKVHHEAENIKYGTFFKAYTNLENGEHPSSSTYCVDLYIDEEDLKTLYGEDSNVNSIESSVKYHVSDNILFIDCPERNLVNIYGINGSLIFSDFIDGSCEIPVHDSFIVIQYQSNKSTITKKFRVK